MNISSPSRPASPKVSAIIPAYKADHLAEAVESVLSQTLKDYELIIVNDGSPYEIRKVLQSHIEAGQIRYIEQENKGVAAARNRGLAEAKGQFIAFLDDDDYWPPDKLDWQVAYLEGHPETGVIVGYTTVVDTNGNIRDQQSLEPGPISIEDFLKGNKFIYSPGQTVIRRGVLGSGDVFDRRYWGADDLDLWIRIAKQAAIIAVPRLALWYRRHGSNANSPVNALRFYEGCEKVFRKHIKALPPADRTGAFRKSIELLYGASGERAIMNCKARLRKGDGSELLRVGAMVMRLMVVAIHDWNFFRRVFMDVFVPVRFRKRAH